MKGSIKTFKFKLYFIEAWGLGMFMVSACFFTTILEYPKSFAHLAIPDPFYRLVIIGVLMGITAYAILNSSWGKLSGAHINPAVTIVNYRLRRISLQDAAMYISFQTIGATAAVYLMQFILGSAFIDKPVQSIVTIPYCGHPLHALIMELTIAFILMLTIQMISNSGFSTYTTKAAGLLVGIYVVVAGPVSGFGMNPARTFASALPAHNWNSFWIYLTAPVAGMLLGNETYLYIRRQFTPKRNAERKILKSLQFENKQDEK